MLSFIQRLKANCLFQRKLFWKTKLHSVIYILSFTPQQLLAEFSTTTSQVSKCFPAYFCAIGFSSLVGFSFEGLKVGQRVYIIIWTTVTFVFYNFVIFCVLFLLFKQLLAIIDQLLPCKYCFILGYYYKSYDVQYLLITFSHILSMVHKVSLIFGQTCRNVTSCQNDVFPVKLLF